MHFNQVKQGFTLIELLVVVLIIGILAVVALPQYQQAVEKSRMAQAVSQMKTILQAENSYHLANGAYTDNFEDLDIDIPGTMRADKKAVSQENWVFVIENVFTNQYIHATRNAYEYENGRWYIVGHLPTGNLYCRALEGDTKSQKMCKLFGPQTGCPWNENEKTCYPIN